MWNPAFNYIERRTATLLDWHRSLCLWVRVGRGTPERPGLLLALEQGGQTPISNGGSGAAYFSSVIFHWAHNASPASMGMSSPPNAKQSLESCAIRSLVRENGAGREAQPHQEATSLRTH